MNNSVHRFIFALVAVFAAALLMVPAAPVFATAGHTTVSNPCFNCLPNDKETLRLKNRTNGDSVWRDPISAKPGDLVGFNVYYNNSSQTEFARNTVITLTLPKNEQTRIDTYATVSSDNVKSANDTGVINVSGSAKVVLQSQAYWYPNQTTANPQIVPVTFVDQGPFIAASVFLGDIGPCYPYQGQVIFEGQLTGTAPSPTPTPTYTPAPTPTPLSYINISKTVRNVNQNTAFLNSVNANQGEQVQFSISVSAFGTVSTAGNVLVQDTLPSYLTLVPGSVRLDNQYVADTALFYSNLDLGTLYPGQTRTIQFLANVATGIPQGTQILTNTARAWSNTGNTVQASAQVIVNGTSYANSVLSLTKQARDLAITTSNTYYSDLYTVPGRDIEFQLVVTNLGNTTATNVTVQDALPSGMTYDVYSTTVDNSQNPDGIVAGGITIGSLLPGQTRTIRFRALVAQTGYFTQNSTQLVNTAYTRADSVSQIQATSNVWVVKQGRVLGAATVDTGANITGLLAFGGTGFGSFALGAYQIARKRMLRAKIAALRAIAKV